MFSGCATQIHAPAPAMSDDFMSSIANIARGAPIDLLDLDMDFEFMSAERRHQLMAPLPTSNEEAHHQYSNFGNAPMQVTGSNAKNVSDSQDQPYDANHNEQARREFQSFDVAPAPRPIKAHRRRRSRHRAYNTPYRHSNYYKSGYATYFDRDAYRPRRSHYSPSRQRDDSPEALKHRSKAIFVAAMADLDVKEERDYDRRGTDSYRGGGNKRRRDGQSIQMFHPMLQQLTKHR